MCTNGTINLHILTGKGGCRKSRGADGWRQQLQQWSVPAFVRGSGDEKLSLLSRRPTQDWQVIVASDNCQGYNKASELAFGECGVLL